MTKLQGAYIGFGNIAERGHWPAYAESNEAEIVAVMDPSPERRAAAKMLKPGLRVYSSAQDLFRTEKLDFVDICTPPSSHAELVITALSHGCHVLCEKPLTLKVAEYQAIAKAAAAADKTVYTVHNWACAPIFQKAFSLIKDGAIGRVWHVEIFTLRNNVCQGSNDAVDAKDWRKNAAIAGGGILIDHGWHSFYLLCELVNAEPTKIQTKMLMEPGKPDGLEEEVQALVQFPEADGYIHLTWRAMVRRNNALIQGRQGSILIDDDRLLLSTLDGKQEEFKFDAALSAGSHHADWFKSLLPNFLAEIKNPVPNGGLSRQIHHKERDAMRGANFKEAGWCLGLTTAAYLANREDFKEVDVVFPGLPEPQAVLASS